MTDIKIKTASSESVVHCGAGAFEKYAKKHKGGVFIVTDKNVYSLYGNLMRETFGIEAVIKVLPAGEKSKNSRNLLSIIGAMAEAGVKRNGLVIAFGGGVVGDIAGLSASLYMRGVRLVQIPTTLLSQVDSSVGGKTAVDFGKIKNLIGTFYQPEEVIADPMFLNTLPKRELNCGLGEIIKYGALDGGIYEKLCKNKDRLYDCGFLGGITADCIRHKADVVRRDEHDLNGIRKTLNLGHTTGHAFELYYGRRPHGEYVLIGMYYELYIAKRKGVCGGEYSDNLISLIKKIVKVPAYADIENSAVLAKHDKKNSDENISLIVPQSEGKSAEIFIGLDEYIRLLNECGRSL